MTLAVFRIGLATAPTVFDQSSGSTLAPGRWHSLRPGLQPARRVVYAASSRALAQLEKRVHANGVAPVGQAMFRLELPAGLKLRHATSLGLPADWRQRENARQALGDRWLDECAALALWVPSFVEPAESNLLINALHPQLGEVTLFVERKPFEFDPRLTN